ncbi:MAG: hypothetical protein CEN87_152 [Parcubacteria group bacterium Licking1014_1]|nr:MAG: hypothetical protein CEN87_152 [Parcubacteria group bacterium Licking1014_1]
MLQGGYKSAKLKGRCIMATMGQFYEVLAILAHRIRPNDIEALDTERFQKKIIEEPDRLASDFVRFLANDARLVVSMVFKLVAKIERDMKGWTCMEQVEAEDGEFEPILQEFLRGEENCLGGEEMIKRTKEQGSLAGLRHAEAMLRNQERIPTEWRKYCLVFSEVWRGPDGGRCVWYLCWGGERWSLRCSWLGLDFDSLDRLVSSRKYLLK